MKKKIIYFLLFVILFILFFNLNKFLFNKKIQNINYKNSIFDIYIQKNIILENNLGINGETKKYKKILDTHKIGKGFFINNYGEFLSSKHIFKDNGSNFYTIINNKKYKLKLLKKYKDKDIILGKIQNYKNKFFIKPNLTKHDYLIYKNQKIYIYKNKKINGKIISLKQNLKELKLKNLVKTNIKLSPGDSGTPIFNYSTKNIIGIATAIDNNNYSYFEIIK